MRLIDADKAIDHIKTRLLETALNNSKELDNWYKLAKSYMVACGASYIYQDCADNRIETWVDEMPTVEPIKHGHWIVDEDGNIKCSECGHCGVGGDNYCERCGAKMDEVKDGPERK